MSEQDPYPTLNAFWPFYLGEHLNPTNRALHAFGSTLGLGCLGLAVAYSPWFILLGFTIGYAFAWTGHFLIEKNRPATFRYPLKSFLCDWRLWFLVLTGGVQREIERLGLNESSEQSPASISAQRHSS